MRAQASPSTERVPTDLWVVLDRSGSMNGTKMRDARAAVRELVSGLGPDDRFALVSYANGARVDLPLGPGSRPGIARTLESIQANGATHLSEGLDVALGPEGNGEDSLARPCVLRDGDSYKMWFSRRGEFYRMGHAESADGWTWERKDDLAGIDVSAEGWDSESIEYPCVFELGGRRYLLYNGNGYGKTGFGLAIAAES